MSAGRIPTTANSPLTAKGDLFTYSTAPARLAVGNDGEQIVADSSATTGLRYQSAYNGNAIINGGMDIAQRGTSINTAASTFAYTLDRLWVYSNGPSVTTSQQATGDTTNLPNIQYCARLQRQSGQTSTTSTVWNFPLETKDSIRFVGQTVTVSYYARKSATFTSTSTVVTLYSGTGTDQSGLGGYTGNVQVVSANPSVTTNWVRYQMTGTVGATATEIRVEFNSGTWIGTAGASDYIEITGVQLELGSIATTFKRSNGAGGSIQGELAACQRYYWRTSKASGYNTYPGYGFTYSTTRVDATVVFPVTMRTTPTSVDYAQVYYQDSNNNTGVISPINIDALANEGSVSIYGTVSGATAGRFVRLTAINAPSATYLGFSAEL